MINLKSSTFFNKKKIKHFDDERSIGNSLIITLQYGYYFTYPSEHVRGFDSLKEAKQAVKECKPCSCSICLSHGDKQ
jgi:hypothetical protein